MSPSQGCLGGTVGEAQTFGFSLDGDRGVMGLSPVASAHCGVGGRCSLSLDLSLPFPHPV